MSRMQETILAEDRYLFIYLSSWYRAIMSTVQTKFIQKNRRRVEMKHLLVKRECRHCGTVLGSVGALRRHLEKQHQIKLSTRPDKLDPERWEMTPRDGNPIPESMEISDGEGNLSRDTLTVRSVLTDVGTSGGSVSASLVPATSVARPAVPAGSATPLRFGDSDGYVNPEDAGQTENHPPTVERSREPIPSDQEISEGREQLREWRKELIAAPRPIVKEFWMSRWRKQTPKLGFSTRLAAEAMLDVAVMTQRKVKSGLDPATAYETRPGAVPVRIRLCTELPSRQLSKKELARLPGWMKASAAAGSAATATPDPIEVRTEEVETATMCFTALSETVETSEEAASPRILDATSPEEDDWVDARLDVEEDDEQFFIFSRKEVVASCEEEL